LNLLFSGNNETALKYTGGMVLAVPVDAELFNLSDEMVNLTAGNTKGGTVSL
jgi:hypothetical protein